jgi:hypothetical protein
MSTRRVLDLVTPSARAEMLQAGTIEAVAAGRAQMGAIRRDDFVALVYNTF